MPTLPLMTSKLLPVPHGFSLREGGVSQGPYASLNTSTSTGDTPENVGENLRRLAAHAEVPPHAFFTVSQVHGDRVVEAPAPMPVEGRGTGVPPPFTEADAVWSARPGTAVGIRTADCVPILLCDAAGTHVMAVHSGWKGTEKRIVERAVEALAQAGVPAGELRAAIGPCIRACCYEVSEDVAGRFRSGFGEGVVHSDERGVRLDLAQAVRHSLLSKGVAASSIDLLASCTACDARRFFSHRRDRGQTGRHLSFIVRPSRTAAHPGHS